MGASPSVVPSASFLGSSSISSPTAVIPAKLTSIPLGQQEKRFKNNQVYCDIPSSSRTLDTTTTDNQPNRHALEHSNSNTTILYEIPQERPESPWKVNPQAHQIHWENVENILKKNLREKLRDKNNNSTTSLNSSACSSKSSSRTTSGRYQAQTNSNTSFNDLFEASSSLVSEQKSLLNKGISFLGLIRWWTIMKLNHPIMNNMTIRQVWKYLAENHKTSSPLYLETSDSLPYTLYEDETLFTNDEKGLPEIVITYNPEDSMNEFMELLKYHSLTSYTGELKNYRYGWIDFLVLDISYLANHFFYLSLDKHSSIFADMENNFGKKIRGLYCLNSSQQWGNIPFLQNIYSLFYFSIFLMNGSTKIEFIYGKNWSFEYFHLLKIIQEWKPMKMNYYLTIEEKDMEVSLSEMMKISKRILLIYKSWNTLKMTMLMYLLKYYDISPFFFPNISPKNKNNSINNENQNDLCDEEKEALNDKKLFHHRSNFILPQWKDLFPNEVSEDWKYMESIYSWYYYDYKLMGPNSSKK